MFCSKCGNEINDEAVICPNCGCPTQNYNKPQEPAVQPNYAPYYQPVYQQKPITELISSARSLGIISIIVGLFIPLVGWICGGIGISKANKIYAPPEFTDDVKSAKTLNLIGLVLSTCVFVIALVVIMGLWY